MAVSKRLRHEILRRDKFRCQHCGHGKEDGVKLTVDHVKAVALGGTDVPENLQALCADCNAGKSATPVDAPLVAEVDERAARWAGAMQTAAQQMLKDIAARRAEHGKFDRAWKRWTLNDGRTFPRPDTWRQSVDQWRSIGVPLEVIVECAEKALANERLPTAAVFKYMAKIVWSKATELQEAAGRSLDSASTPNSDDDCSPAFWRGRSDMANDLLWTIGQDRGAAALAAIDADGETSANDRKPDAAVGAIEDLLEDLDSLCNAVNDLFSRVPDDVMSDCRKTTEVELDLHMGKDGWNSYDLMRNMLRHLGIHLGGSI
jgi:hypothetical protein